MLFIVRQPCVSSQPDRAAFAPAPGNSRLSSTWSENSGRMIRDAQGANRVVNAGKMVGLTPHGNPVDVDAVFERQTKPAPNETLACLSNNLFAQCRSGLSTLKRKRGQSEISQTCNGAVKATNILYYNRLQTFEAFVYFPAVCC